MHSYRATVRACFVGYAVQAVINNFLPLLFKKTGIRESCVIRVTRNADVFLSDKLTDETFRDLVGAFLRPATKELLFGSGE